MHSLISSHHILRSNKDFVFEIPHPTFRDNDHLTNELGRMFTELKALDFDHLSEVAIFKTFDNRIGFIGEEFTNWYPEKPPGLGISLIDSSVISTVHLLQMKPAKGPGFCTLSFSPASTEFVIFFFQGSDRNWDHNFKKTDKLMKEISEYLGCQNVSTSTAYNC